MNQPKRTKIFKRYADSKSKVTKFLVQHDAMEIRFSDNTAFRYTNQSAGPENIAKMKEAALAGKGLDAILDGGVKAKFVRKIR